MISKKFWRVSFAAMLLVLAAAFSMGALAQSSSGDHVCPKGPGASKIFTQFCYACLFPISIAGSGNGDPNVPIEAAKETVCFCRGWWDPGVTMGMWYPMRVIETTRTEYCSPTTGGSIGSGDTGALGKYEKHQGGDSGPHDEEGQYGGFMNMHVFLYPIGKIIGQMASTECLSDTSAGSDLVYISEIDPTWSNDDLANVLTPESKIFANPIAVTACSADAVAASTYQPISLMIWCLGSWGTMYPMNGNAFNKSIVMQNSLIAAHGLAHLHRIGMANKTMGDDAVCANYPIPILPKDQYKFEQLWPVPELSSDHWIGESSLRWGENRFTPTVGEDYVNLIWNWDDCCAQL